MTLDSTAITWDALPERLAAFSGHPVAARLVSDDHPRRLVAVLTGVLKEISDEKHPTLFLPIANREETVESVERAGVSLDPHRFIGAEERVPGEMLVVHSAGMTLSLRRLHPAEPSSSAGGAGIDVVDDPTRTIVVDGKTHPAMPQLAQGRLLVPIANAGSRELRHVTATVEIRGSRRSAAGPDSLQPAGLAVLSLDHYDALPDFRIRLCAEVAGGGTIDVAADFHADVATYAIHRAHGA